MKKKIYNKQKILVKNKRASQKGRDFHTLPHFPPVLPNWPADKLLTFLLRLQPTPIASVPECNTSGEEEDRV